MLKRNLNNSSSFSILSKKYLPFIFSRDGHFLRGKPPGVAKSLKQKLAEEQKLLNEETLPRVNIGFPGKRISRSETLKERMNHLKNQRKDPKFEKLARSGTLTVDLPSIRKDTESTTGQFLLQKIADHYGIYTHLFGNAFFIPRIPLKVQYGKEDFAVYNGNVLNSIETKNAPNVIFDSTINLTNKKDVTNYWTLLMVNPDSHLFADQEGECIHWFIANIPNNEIDKGEKIVNYLQPFPAKGLGYQRIIFLLFKQNDKVDFNELKPKDLESLNERKFNTLEFYRKHQNDITPAGLSFFQCKWDESISSFYRSRNLKEPIFEYDFPKYYIADQKWFPLKQPFNLYMDKYIENPKEVNKDYLRPYLFKDLDFPIKYPLAHPIKNVPSWLRTEIKKERIKMAIKNESSNMKV